TGSLPQSTPARRLDSPEYCGFFAHRHGTCLNRRMEPSMESRSELRSEENAGAVGDRPARPEVDSLLARAGTRPPSNEVRASLAAIQAARAAAELRLQRDSLRVRVLTMAILAVVAAGTFALAGHLRARRRAGAASRAAAAQVMAAPQGGPSLSVAGSRLTVDSTPGTLPAGGSEPTPSSGAASLAN